MAYIRTRRSHGQDVGVRAMETRGTPKTAPRPRRAKSMRYLPEADDDLSAVPSCFNRCYGEGEEGGHRRRRSRSKRRPRQARRRRGRRLKSITSHEKGANFWCAFRQLSFFLASNSTQPSAQGNQQQAHPSSFGPKSKIMSQSRTPWPPSEEPVPLAVPIFSPPFSCKSSFVQVCFSHTVMSHRLDRSRKKKQMWKSKAPGSLSARMQAAVGAVVGWRRRF